MVNFERMGNAKRSTGIGTISKVESLLKEINGCIISYDDYINFKVGKYLDDHAFCVVIKDSTYTILRSSYYLAFKTGPIEHLIAIINEEKDYDSGQYDLLSDWDPID